MRGCVLGRPAPDFCARSVRPARSDLRTSDHADLPGTVDLAHSGAELELRPDRSDGAICTAAGVSRRPSAVPDIDPRAIVIVRGRTDPARNDLEALTGI
jgi:hypothetical protein